VKGEHLYLVGFMGSGKSTIGPILAELLQREFVDLDDRIVERAGKSIPEIFKEQGEQEFRRLESACLKQVARRPGAVVALGGGALESGENRETIARSGRCLWLKVDLEEAWNRCRRNSDRPLARSRPEFERRFRLREPLFAACEWQVETSGATPEEVSNRIVQLII
jgi:shikimate kinase